MQARPPGVAGLQQLWGGPPPPAGQGTGSRVIHTLRRVEGNWRCADCSAPDPDWASLNLGILLCIQCSGVHRRLGVHISKVCSPGASQTSTVQAPESLLRIFPRKRAEMHVDKQTYMPGVCNTATCTRSGAQGFVKWPSYGFVRGVLFGSENSRGERK